MQWCGWEAGEENEAEREREREKLIQPASLNHHSAEPNQWHKVDGCSQYGPADEQFSFIFYGLTKTEALSVIIIKLSFSLGAQ